MQVPCKRPGLSEMAALGSQCGQDGAAARQHPEVLQHLSGAGNKQNLPKQSEKGHCDKGKAERCPRSQVVRWPLGTCVTGCREGPPI